MIHIGRRIKEVLDSQPKSHNIEWFAARLNCKRANIYNIFNRAVIDTQLLYQISEVLDHDFFKDFSDDLARTRGENLGEKKRVYNEIMISVGNILSKRLRRMAFAGNIPGFRLNRWDTETSPLPALKYIVVIRFGEDPDVSPHLHLYSKEEKFTLRFTLSATPRLMPVKNYGSRELSDNFRDIIKLVQEWFRLTAIGEAEDTTNREYAFRVYNTINAGSNMKNPMDGFR